RLGGGEAGERVGEERGAGGADSAADAFDADLQGAVGRRIGQHRDDDAIAAQRVVQLLAPGGRRRERALVPRAAGVVHHHVAVQRGQLIGVAHRAVACPRRGVAVEPPRDERLYLSLFLRRSCSTAAAAAI